MQRNDLREGVARYVQFHIPNGTDFSEIANMVSDTMGDIEQHRVRCNKIYIGESVQDTFKNDKKARDIFDTASHTEDKHLGMMYGARVYPISDLADNVIIVCGTEFADDNAMDLLFQK